MLLLSMTAVALSGCNAAYLHNESLAKKTAGVHADFGKITLGDVFQQQEKYLSAFALDEDAAVADYATALRDQTLANLIRPDPLDSSKLSAVARLRDRIDGDLLLVYGSADLDEPKLRRLTVLAERRQVFLVTRSDAENDYQQALAEFL